MPDVSAGAKSQLGQDVRLQVIVNKGGRWAHRVLIALEEAGLAYETVEIDLANKPKWLLDANPAGLVPVLAVGSPPVYLTESADIVQYIVAASPHLGGRDDLQRAEAAAFARSTLALLEKDLLPVFNAKTPPASGHHERQLASIRRVQDLLHPVGPYALGERFTVADILIAPFVGRLWFYGKHGIAPAGTRTVESLQQDPAYGRYLAYTRAILSRKSWTGTWDEDYSIGRLRAKIEIHQVGQIGQPPKYPRFLPEVFDPEESFPEPIAFDHVDKGHAADPALPDLLPIGSKIDELTPVIGSEIRGVQLSSLDERALDQLALLVAQRGVVVFRDQDFKDIAPEKQLAFVRYFGPHYLHPADRHPAGLPEYYSIFQDATDSSIKRAVNVIDNRLSSVTWHTDGSSELQPPGLTLLFVLENPSGGGGDTLYTSTTEAYERLSPEFRQRLDGLQAEHFLPYDPKRREAPRNIHPVVRTHPVTGKKILFVNEVNTTRIIGYRKEESDNLIAFLTGHIARGQDFACRIKWEEGSVVVWDNRSTQHTATTNFPKDQRRHLCRITSVAERPV